MSRPRPDQMLSEDEMLAQERAFLWPKGGPRFRAGLALSGGGIRAATFSLGVLQVLAAQGLLKRFHYMSTVSGSGYIGSSLSWFWSTRRIEDERKTSAPGDPAPIHFGAGPEDFPFQDNAAPATAIGKQAAANLAFLRNHGSYLTSGDGVGFTGLVLAVVRTVLLSLTIWVPLLVGCFFLIEVMDKKLISFTPIPLPDSDDSSRIGEIQTVLANRPLFALSLALAALLLLLFVVGSFLLLLISRRPHRRTAAFTRRTNIFRVAYFGLGGLLAGAGAYRLYQEYAGSIQLETKIVIVVLVVVSFALLMLAVAEVFSPANHSYFLRRSFEKWSSRLIPFAIALAFVGALPLVADRVPPTADDPWTFGAIGSVITLLGGAGVTAYGYYLRIKNYLPSKSGQLIASIGSLFFVASLIIISFYITNTVLKLNFNQYDDRILLLILTYFVTFIVLGWGSVNATGFHRFYRDRLMETFMPSVQAIQRGDALQSNIADNLSVGDLARSPEEREGRPYHLINAHAILCNDRDRKIALRGGDNFLISAAFIGSSATGWATTGDYARQHGPLTLASAMAASGAAANAHAGYVGTGLTRDRFVSTVMSILNIRLGLWVGNPRKVRVSQEAAGANAPIRSAFQAWVPTYLRTVLPYGVLGLGHHRNARFLELSDGGHFENLGLYELARRKLDLIVVVDAEEDGAINLSALVSSTKRIKEDFGATIRFLDGRGPEVLLGRDSQRYPRGVRLAAQPYIVGEIHYADGGRGVLVYIKSTMIDGLDFTTNGYRAANETFPHQSTLDQFFDPDQFEAYRDLGRRSCSIMTAGLDLTRTFGDTDALLAQAAGHSTPSVPTPLSSSSGAA